MLPLPPSPPPPDELLIPPVPDDQMGPGCVSWQLLSVTLHRTPQVGFGIAISGGSDNPHFTSGEPAVVISDVVLNGPAWGLLQVNDRILSANGVSFENIDYNTAVEIIKNAEQINMIVKRRVAMPVLEFEQRTLKFTLSKSRKKDDFGIVLGCKFYIKEIRNPKLAEKDPGLREGDSVLRINGQTVDGATLEECNKWLERSRDKLCLVIQRDVRRGSSRWPSQNTVYERVGSVGATPRHSPSPMMHHQSLSQRSSHEYVNSNRWRADSSVEDQSRRISSPATSIPSHASHNEYEYYVRSQSKQEERGQRTITFRKVGGSVGVRVIGGNHVGIFVSAVAAESPAALHGVCCGDKILQVNGRCMRSVTRESAVQLLLALEDTVTLLVEHARQEFEHVRNSQLGDNFYIRAHFTKEKRKNDLEMTISEGDIFHVTDTLFGGTVGLWQAARVYSASNHKGEAVKGVIPNESSAEILAREQKKNGSEKKGGTLLRRKLESRRTKSLPKNILSHPFSGSIPIPAYERVALNTPTFPRPLVLLGPLADVARSMLLRQFALRFAEAEGDAVIRLAAVDAVISAGKHCVMDISVESVERLQLAQYAPIVVLIDVDSRSRIRDLRKKTGAAHESSKKLMEQAQNIKKNHSHLLSATVDASQEDGWFDALKDLIAHLQQRRLWMPEFPPNLPLEDVLLFPNNKTSGAESDVESSKDYGDYSQRSEISSPLTRSAYEWDRSMGGPSTIGPPSVGGSSLGGPSSCMGGPASSLGGPSGVGAPGALQRSLRDPGQPSESPALSTFRSCTLTPECSQSPAHQSFHPMTSSAIPSPAHSSYCNHQSQPINRYQTLPHKMERSCVDISLEPRPNRGSTPVPCPGPPVPIRTTPSPVFPGARVKSPTPTYLRTACNGQRISPTNNIRLSPCDMANSSTTSVTHIVNRTNQNLTNGGLENHYTDNRNQPQHGYYHIKQLLNDDSLYSSEISDRLTSDLQKVELKDNGSVILKDKEREKEEATRRFNDAAEELKQAQHRLQIPLEPPSSDMYCAREEGSSSGLGRGSGIGSSVGSPRRSIGGMSNPTSPNNRMHQESEDNPPSFSSFYNSNGNPSYSRMNGSRPALAPKPRNELIRSRVTDLHSSVNKDHMSVRSEAVNGNSSLNESKTILKDNGNELTKVESTFTQPFTMIDETSAAEKTSSDEEPTVVEETSALVGADGGVLCCPASRVELRIPPGALPPGPKREIYVKVCNEDSGSPPIDRAAGEALLSPLVICGPKGLTFLKPAELRLPHNGISGEWSFSLKAEDGGEWKELDIGKNNQGGGSSSSQEGKPESSFLSVPIHSF